jgi:hypothetical protein
VTRQEIHNSSGEDVFGFEAEDLLSFVSWQGLHAGREGY